MAQIIEQGITLGGGRIVGTVSVNGGEIRGEGGPLRPQLVIPVKFKMNQHSEGAMIAVTSLAATLGIEPHVSPANAICQPVFQNLASRFPVTSQLYANEPMVEVRFSLNVTEVEHIEARRHTANSDVFTMHLNLDVVVAGLKPHNGPRSDEFPWDQLGTFAEVFPFWTTQVQPVQINIDQSSWVNKVLPGLGYDQLRLIELKFPPPLPDHGNAAKQFDKAKRALDERRYDDCIKECRDLLTMWEKQFGATGEFPVADAIARDRHWASGDDRRELVYALWQKLRKTMNEAHHSERPVIKMFDRRDARLVLVMLAALSEYIEQQ